MAMLGLVTLVTRRVDSVTSTCLRSSLGEGRTYSAPMVPVSSGTFLSGQRSRTRGLSAARVDAVSQSAAKIECKFGRRMGNAPLPNPPDRIRIEGWVSALNRSVLHQCLRDQQPIKGIAVVEGQRDQLRRMLWFDWEYPEAGLEDRLLDK